MRTNLTLCLTLISLWSVIDLSPRDSSTFAQSSSQEKPKRRDFGSSLKRLKWDDEKQSGLEDESQGAEKRTPDKDYSLRLETTLVICEVSVSDRQGRPVQGLSRRNFLITEDDKAQEISFFSLGGDRAIPRTIVLIMDYSGSLWPYINTSVEAAKILVDQLGPKDKLALVTDDLSLLGDFSQDKPMLKERLETLKKVWRPEARNGGVRGHSLQYSALMAAFRELFDDEDIRPIIIFQTDGSELDLLRPLRVGLSPQSKALAREFSLKDVYTEAEKSRATVYNVIPGVRFMGLSQNEQLNQAKVMIERNMQGASISRAELSKLLEKWIASGEIQKVIEHRVRCQSAIAGIAELTGGRTEFLESPDQATEIYSRILEGIDRRYILGYYPANEERDGKRRRVKIEVRGHPEFTVSGRKSYILPRTHPAKDGFEAK